jgi:hypothetical protein
MNQSESVGALFSQQVSGSSLQVLPTTNIFASGNQGGSFSPTSFSYMLSATSGTVSWQLLSLPGWLNASPTSGTVGTSPTPVTLTINNSVAASLPPDEYTAKIVFSNVSNPPTVREARSYLLRFSSDRQIPALVSRALGIFQAATPAKSMG